MAFSFTVGAFILLFCIGQMRAAVVFKIPSQERIIPPEKFKLRITESGTRFDESIEIDEQNDIEYFRVPAHNGLTETDNLLDFRMNITVSRVNSDGVCHITPLPQDMPRPNVLARGLRTLAGMPPSQNIINPAQEWGVGDIVDKDTLRPEVQKFCGHFPIYRLKPFIPPDSVSVTEGDDDNTLAERKKRAIFRDIALCNNNVPNCNPNRWVFRCQIARRGCLYWAKCELDQSNIAVSCSSLVHGHSNLRCCIPSCGGSGYWPKYG